MTGKQLEKAYKENRVIWGLNYMGKAKASSGRYYDVYLDINKGNVWASAIHCGLTKMFNPNFVPSKIAPAFIALCLSQENYNALARIIRDFMREAY